MATQLAALELTRDGRINCNNYVWRGYDRVTHGVYARRDTAQPTDEWAAQRAQWFTKVRSIMALYSGKPVVLYGPSALQVLGVQLPERLQDWTAVHLMVDDQKRRTERCDVTWHTSSKPLKIWRLIHGLPVLNPVDHWLQLKGAKLNDMVEVGDGFLRRQNPLLTIDEMRDRLAELKMIHGVKLARRAMTLVRAGTDSLYETRIRLLLVKAGLPTPDVNLAVWCPIANKWYHPDMAYKEAQLAVEFDGQVHVGSREQMDIDALRRRQLQDAGWLIITITSSQLRNPSDFIRSVKMALALRTA